MPRRAISPSKAPSMRTPPDPLMEPCQITPDPSTDVIRSTAWTGCCVSAGVVLRLNIWRLFYLERHNRDTSKRIAWELVKKDTRACPVACLLRSILPELLAGAFFFLGADLHAHRVEAGIHVEDFAGNPPGEIGRQKYGCIAYIVDGHVFA